LQDYKIAGLKDYTVARWVEFWLNDGLWYYTKLLGSAGIRN
jgi:hypothetical protein